MKVSVGSNQGWLRLRWRYQGKPYSLNVGLADSPTNRAYAQQIAGQIQFDILGNQFDNTLLKYKPQTLGKNAAEITVPDLFKRFTDNRFKDKNLSQGSQSRYDNIHRHLTELLNVPARGVTDKAAKTFSGRLTHQLSENIARSYLYLIEASFDWAEGKYHIPDSNPFRGLAKKIKQTPSQPVKPFTEQEISTISRAFRTSPHYNHYTDFIDFLFGVGCRFGEAAGLRWIHISDNYQTVWIGESITRGHRKSTKTGKARTVVLPPSISKMLRSRRERLQPSPNDLVFPSPTGLPIDDHNFRNRAWKTILEQCHIEYRKPYNTRHSAISHALANGANPIELAEQSGHDKRVLLSTYAHAIRQKPVFMEFGTDDE